MVSVGRCVMQKSPKFLAKGLKRRTGTTVSATKLFTYVQFLMPGPIYGLLDAVDVLLSHLTPKSSLMIAQNLELNYGREEVGVLISLERR